MQKPGFELLWKRKLPNEPVQLNSLMPAILMDRYIGYRGFRSFAFVAGSSNAVWAIDSDLNRVEWETKFPVKAAAGSANCPGGLTSPIARPTIAAYPVPNSFGGLGGRGAAAHSDVGRPGEGAVTIAAALRPAANPNPPPAMPRNPVRRPPAVIYALSSDGKLHAMYISNGVEPDSALPFLPADANADGLIVIDEIAYASTHNCNGAPAGVWALDLSTKQVSSWKPASGDIAGSAGPAFGPDGTVYAATTAGELVALNAEKLTLKASYSSGGQGFTTSPVVFPYRQKNLIAAAAKDGTIHVIEESSANKAFLKSRASAILGAGALSTWQSVGGTRWLLAATGDSIKAWRIVDRNGAAVIEEGWTSREMRSPLPPMIINGVVFALAGGDKTSSAILYALDGATGKPLWDSGKTITSFAHSGGLSGGAGQIYFGTYDGTLYAFGYPIEH